MWLLTTRNRKELCQEVLDACIATGTSTKGVVWMDGCDYGELRLPDGWKSIACAEHLNIGEILRRFYAENPDLPWYGWMSDDCKPLSNGWDIELIKAADKYNIAYPDDGWQQGKNAAGVQHVTSLICFGGELPRTMGFWALPKQIQMYIDDVWESVAVPAGLMRYCPEVKAHHKHFANGERPADATDTRLFNGIHFPTHDGNIHGEWIKSAEYRECLKRVYEAMGKKFTTFVCLKSGTGFSVEYVNILRDMVLRNTKEGIIGRFVCITDDCTGLDAGIEVMPLPDDLETWYGKLYMFKRGLFPEGEKLAFMDLDTVITGRLDEILQYDGQFATLRDFYQPERLGPAIILWKAGSFAYSIWDEWEQQGKPRNDMGDLWWLNNLDQGRFAHEVDKLQDLFSGRFVSYKKDCLLAPPNSASVVCFHGLPRPHQVEGWIQLFWKKGGYCAADFEVVCNTELSKVVENIKYSSSLELPWLELKTETERKAIICGGGPSLVDSLPDIERERIKGSLIVALNGSGTFLKENGIYSDWLVMIDSRESNVKFVKDDPARQYFIASQCDRVIFEELKDKPLTLFHIDIPHIGEYVIDNGKTIQAIGGGSTVGLMAMCVAYTQGYRDIHLYGFDSSFENEAHAYGQEQNDEVIEAIVAGKSFKTTPWMVTQTTQWQDLTNQLRQLGCAVTVHGEGLLPYLAWIKSIEETLTT